MCLLQWFFLLFTVVSSTPCGSQDSPIFFLFVHCRIINSVWKSRLENLRRKRSELIENKQLPEAHIDRQSSSEIVDQT